MTLINIYKYTDMYNVLSIDFQNVEQILMLNWE